MKNDWVGESGARWADGFFLPTGTLKNGNLLDLWVRQDNKGMSNFYEISSTICFLFNLYYFTRFFLTSGNKHFMSPIKKILVGTKIDQLPAECVGTTGITIFERK